MAQPSAPVETGGRPGAAATVVTRLPRPGAVAAWPPRLRGLPSPHLLLARTSALENVELPLVYAGTPAPERRKRALAMLDQVGLLERASHQPAQLSGGQQQRVAIARALVTRPLLILADEPTGALDSRTSLEIMGLLQALNRQGMTVVLVTHEPDVARFATRILRFRDGRVVEDHANAHPEDAQAALRAEAATA